MIEASYSAEQLTRIGATILTPSNTSRRWEVHLRYAFCRRADDIADGDYTDLFPGGSEDSNESIDYRSEIERIMGEPVGRDAYDQDPTVLLSKEAYGLRALHR